MDDPQITNLDPAIILVEPQMGENIGAAARVMHNFGLTDLRIVAPRDGWPNDKAIAMASGAQVIDHVRVFDTTAEAVAELHGVFAATARRRDMAKPVVSPREAIDVMRRAPRDRSFGVLFGRERSGLTNEDVVLADTVLTVPLNPAFQSLNLAQAVAIVAYECFIAPLPAEQGAEPEIGERPATKAELMGMLEQLERSLEVAGYFDPVPQKKPSMVRNLRNIFQRATLLEQDVRTLRGVLKALARGKQGGMDDG